MGNRQLVEEHEIRKAHIAQQNDLLKKLFEDVKQEQIKELDARHERCVHLSVTSDFGYWKTRHCVIFPAMKPSTIVVSSRYLTITQILTFISHINVECMPCDFIPNTGWVVTKLTFNPLTGQSKEYTIVICCFSAKLAI